MPPPIRSLARDVSTTRALELLGVASEARRRSRCPLCQQVTLHWYEDAALDADWLHCGSCGFAGDVLELARQAFGIGLQETIAHLTEEGVFRRPVPSDDIGRFAADHVDHRCQLQQFWQESRTYTVRDIQPSTRDLLDHLGAAHLASNPSWRS